jgi:arylsulfatase A-like enzyme
MYGSRVVRGFAIVMGLAACAIGIAASETPGAGTRPNIILLLADDMDYADISLNAGKKTPTPHIDSIANSGVQFTQAYVTCPVCGPSRVGILTGRYQDRVGFVSNHGPQIPENFGLPSSEVLVPEMLKAAGYSTGMMGKWHLGFKPDMTPNAQGFDYFFGHLHGFHDYHPGVQKPGPILRNAEPVKTTKWLTTTLAEEAAGFIERNTTSPYFLYVPFSAVHDPLQAPEELLQKFSHIQNQRDRTMAAMLYEMDAGIGKILDAVKASGAEQRTLVVFFNDNGGVRGNLPESNGPLRGGKAMLYEGGIRVPLLMRWPGVITAGTKYDNPVIGLDLLPTFLAAAGTTTTVKVEGVDLLPYLQGKATGKPHERLFWRFVDAPNQRAVLDGNFKLVQMADDAPWELYDLAKDLGETKDLAAQMADKVAKLAAEWDEWNKDNKDPLWLDPRVVRRRAEMAADAASTGTAGKPRRRPPGDEE